MKNSENKPKYIAHIDEYDVDTHAFVQCNEHEVDSWEEAMIEADEYKWEGSFGVITKLVGADSGGVVWTKAQWDSLCS